VKAPILLIFFTRKRWIGYFAACFASFRTDTRPTGIDCLVGVVANSGRLTSARGRGTDRPRHVSLLAKLQKCAWCIDCAGESERGAAAGAEVLRAFGPWAQLVPPRAAWLTSKREAGSSVTLYRNPVALLVDAACGRSRMKENGSSSTSLSQDGSLRTMVSSA